MRSIVLLILLATAPAVWSQAAGEAARSPVDRIADCSHSAKEDVVGLTDLENACPGLTSALQEAGYLPLLSTAERDALDVYGLSDLLAVDDWYRQQEARDVDVSTLAPILDSLHAEEPDRAPGLLERFQRWLRSLFERRKSDPDTWFSRWLDELNVSQTVVRTILLVAIGLLLVMVVGVIYNELRAAGLLRQRPVVQDDAVRTAASSASADDLDPLSADRKASLLLRMLVATLVRSGRLRTERGLTHRELSARATFDDAQQRESFRRVASLAERTVYGGRELTAEEVEPVVAVARALDAQLRGASA